MEDITYELNSEMFYLTAGRVDSYYDHSMGVIESYEEIANELDDDDERKGQGRYEINRDKYREFLAVTWLEAFSERLKEKGIKASVAYQGVWSPREYNFTTDRCEFTLTLSPAEREALGIAVGLGPCQSVFRAYLRLLYRGDTYRPDGSLVSYEEWERAFHDEDDEYGLHTHAFATLLGFFLFAADCESPDRVKTVVEENCEEFFKAYEEAQNVSNANGGLDAAMDWIEEKRVCAD
jgi:hypothetical protein